MSEVKVYIFGNEFIGKCYQAGSEEYILKSDYDKVAEIERDFQLVRQQRDLARERADSLQSRITALEQRNGELEEMVEDLNIRLKNASARADKNKQHNEELEKQIRELNAELDNEDESGTLGELLPDSFWKGSNG